MHTCSICKSSTVFKDKSCYNIHIDLFSIDLCPPNKHAIKRIEVAVYNMMRRICCLYRGEVVTELTPLTYMFRIK